MRTTNPAKVGNFESETINPMCSYRVDGSCLRVSNPKGGAAHVLGTHAGCIQIKLPAWPSQTFIIEGDVYQYGADMGFQFMVGGYGYATTPAWVHPFAKIIGKSPAAVKVRFARNAANDAWYILLGETNTSWVHFHVAINSISVGIGQAIANFKEGWEITLVTSLAGYNIDVTVNDATIQADVKAQIEVGDLKAPTKALAMNSQKVTGLLAPTAAGDALSKSSAVLAGAEAANVANANVIGGIPVIHRLAIAGGVNADTDITLTHKTRILDAWMVLKAAGTAGSVVTIKSTANAISNAVDIAAGGDKARFGIGTIDDAYHEIAAAGVLRVSIASTGGDCPALEVYALGIRVA